MESDETKRLRSEIKAIVARGFAALKTMVDMLTSRVDKNFDNIAALRERLAALEERITNVKDDVTGQHHLHVEVARIKVREEVYKEIKVDENNLFGVVKGDAGAPHLLGKRVFVLHPHHDRFIAPAAMCTPVPDDVPDRRAVLAANMETAVNILWDARPMVGERALVVGAGVVGLLATWLLARIPGLDLHVCDLDATRGDLVQRFGARFCAPDDAPANRDLIVHASASPAGLRLALARAGFEARIIEASWFGAKECPLPLGEAFHSKRLSLISTQVGHIAAAMRGRRSYGERLALALSLLADPALDALLGPDTAFANLPQSMGRLLSPPTGAPQPLCPIVTYI